MVNLVYYARIIQFLTEKSMQGNSEFYKYCMEYFNALRKQGKNDDGFEDEYYFTMPGMSSFD